MQILIHRQFATAGYFFPLWPGERRLAVRKLAVPMLADRMQEADRTYWACLISSVATVQDRDAFARLFEYFAPRIKVFMQRSGVDGAKAEELAQEAMLAVWRKAGLFDAASTGAAAWIFTIARNLRIDAYRREQRGALADVADVDSEYRIDESPQQDLQLAAAQSEVRVRAALAQLTSEQVRVVELSFFEEKAHGEIAKILNIPLGTVKSRLRLAMNKLRTLLRE